MKSERRHKLQQNALAHSLENLPKMGRESGSKLLLGIVVVLLVIVLIRFYLNSREQKKELITSQLTSARADLGVLSGDRLMGLPPDQLAEDRKKTLESIEKKLDAVLADSTEPADVAQAKNIRGDAYLQLATLGDPIEATTRPDLAMPRKVDDLLDDAGKNYQQVLEMKTGVPPAEVADAHFGLAAIAENQRDWEKARQQYKSVAADSTIPKVFTDYATMRLAVVDKISVPFVTGKLMTPATSPTSLPSSAPAPASTGPTTGPSTLSIGPETTPATSTAVSTPVTLPTTSPTTVGS